MSKLEEALKTIKTLAIELRAELEKLTTEKGRSKLMSIIYSLEYDYDQLEYVTLLQKAAKTE